MTKPLPYQYDGIDAIHEFSGRALLADEMGLGKTFQALKYAMEADAWPAVAICPVSAKFTWQREAMLHFNLRAEILEGTRPPRARLYIPHRLVVINYDILEPWMPYLLKLKPQTVFIDECHKIGSMTTLRTGLVYKLCEKVPHIIGMDGTPFTNRPIQLWPIIHLLRPDVFHNFPKFARKHCKPRRRWYGWTYKGAERLDILHKKLRRTCMIRRLKSEVLKDLPPKRRIVVPLEIEDKKQYRQAINDFRTWFKENVRGKRRRFRKAEELVKVGYVKRLAAKLKLASAINWIDNFLEESDDKIIVFGIHKYIIRALREHYRKKAVVIDGNTSALKRQQNIDRFHSDKHTRILIGNIQAAGVNWSCKCTSTVAFVELSWTPGEHVQAEDRVHGLERGQKGVSVSCYYLVGEGTIEEKLCELLQVKQGDLHHTLDGARMEELNIFDLLVKELSRAA